VAVDLLPFRIGQRAPACQVFSSQGLQEIGVLFYQMLDMQPVDVHDALKYLRGVDPGAVGQERIRPYTWSTHVNGLIRHLPPPCPLALDSMGFLHRTQALSDFHPPTYLAQHDGFVLTILPSGALGLQGPSENVAELSIAFRQKCGVRSRLGRQTSEWNLSIIMPWVDHGFWWQIQNY